jgi:hypothetical protein
MSALLTLLAQDSIDRGVFLLRQGDPVSGPRLSAVLSVALDVATGMAYLHECGIIHGGAVLPADAVKDWRAAFERRSDGDTPSEKASAPLSTERGHKASDHDLAALLKHARTPPQDEPVFIGLACNPACR